MTSIINASRNITSDRFWLIKIICIALPLFFLLNSPKYSVDYFSFDNLLFYAGYIAILTGCGSFIINRNINNLSPILPGFVTIHELILKIFVSAVLMAPVAALYIYSIIKINEHFSYDIYVMGIIYFIVTAIFVPFLFLPMVFYSVKGKFSDSFRIGALISSAGNFILSFISYLIQYVFTYGIVWYLFYMTFSSLLNDIVIINLLNSIFVVLSILSLFSYISDEYGNSIVEIYTDKSLYT